MKPILAFFVLLVAFVPMPRAHAQFLPGMGPNQSANGGPQMIDRIVAIVGNGVILQSDLDQALQAVRHQYASNPGQLPPTDVLERQVLNRLILMQLQVQRANDQGMRVSNAEINNAVANIASGNHMTPAQLQQAITQQGGDYAAFRRNVAEQILVQKLRDKVVRQSVQVTDAEVDNLVKDSSFQTGRIHLAHIDINVPNGASAQDIANARAKAEEAEAAIRGGMDFRAAAIRYSEAPDALDGGDIGWRNMDEVPPAFAGAIQKLDVGQITAPLRAPDGFHIFKLIARDSDKHDVVTEYHVRQILIKPSDLVTSEQAYDKAQQIYRQLTSGGHVDFAALAKKVSDDNATANLGGDLGWSQIGAHGPAIANALQNMKQGEVSRPFQTQDGWDIIKLVATRQNDVTQEIRRQRARIAIGNRKAREVYADFLRQLRSSAYVSIRVPALRSPDQSQGAS